MKDGYQILTMTPDDIATAVDWAAAEGWNPGHADAGCFAAVDPEGFIGGWVDGRMVASISVVNYDPDFAFLGFYIVDPAHRGRGYGYRLWQAGIAHAGDRLVGLDGVPAEQANYRRSGFRLAYRNIRYGGVPAAGSGKPVRPPGLEIRATAGCAPELLAYDRPLFPAARPAFLERWLDAPGHVVRTAWRDGAPAGYGVIRPCRTGHKIGPLFADDRAAAEALVLALLDARADDADTGEVFLDVPEPNAGAVGLATSLGLAPVFETARMYTGAAPAIDLGRVFGVTTFELG